MSSSVKCVDNSKYIPGWSSTVCRYRWQKTVSLKHKGDRRTQLKLYYIKCFASLRAVSWLTGTSLHSFIHLLLVACSWHVRHHAGAHGRKNRGKDALLIMLWVMLSVHAALPKACLLWWLAIMIKVNILWQKITFASFFPTHKPPLSSIPSKNEITVSVVDQFPLLTFIKPVFLDFLLCSRHYFTCWGYNGELDKNLKSLLL